MRITTRSVGRSLLVVLAALVGSVALGFTTAFTAAVGLAATTALIVPGTGTMNPAPVLNYMPNAVNYYLVPAGDCAGGCTAVAVPYLAQFWPIPLPGWGGLQGAKWNVSVQSGVDSLNEQLVLAPDGPVTIFGYSQGATVVSLVKGELAGLTQAEKDNLNIFVIGNPQRADGGFFERFAILGTVPVLDATFGRPTRTDTCQHSDGTHCATDFALMYDGVVDFPEWILNPLAVVNAAAGFQYVHPTYLSPSGTDEPPPAAPYGYTVLEVQSVIANASAPGGCTAVNFCQRTGDTIFITLPARVLPIMQPFLDIADATGTSALVIPIVDLISPFTQTLIETAYTRDDYGVPSPARLLPRFNPIQVATDLINDIPEGVNAALAPGLTPLPPLAGTGPSMATTLVDTNAVDTKTVNTTTPKLFPDRKPLTRLSMIARPNEGLVLPDATTKPERSSLRGLNGANVHPIRDTVQAVAGAAKKALGKDRDSGGNETSAAP